MFDFILFPVIVILILLLLIVYLIDINHFVRVGVIYWYALLKRKPLSFLSESVIYGRVLPFDADIQLTHMNNARVLREYDFGRLDFWTRSSLMDGFLMDLLTMKIRPVFAVASTIRYRRPLHMFSKYKIVTKAAYWQERILYHEQKMVTLNDGIVRNIGYTKVIFPFSIDEFVQKNHPDVAKPELPKDLEIWMKYNEANALRSKPFKRELSIAEAEEEEAYHEMETMN